MGRLVDLTNVMWAIDSATTLRYGASCRETVQDAVRDVPSPPFVPSPSEAASQKRAAFNGVFAQGQALTESLEKLAKWMEDAETDDIVELQRIAKRVSEKVNQVVGLKENRLMKQLQSIRASKN